MAIYVGLNNRIQIKKYHSTTRDIRHKQFEVKIIPLLQCTNQLFTSTEQRNRHVSGIIDHNFGTTRAAGVSGADETRRKLPEAAGYKYKIYTSEFQPAQAFHLPQKI